MYELSNKPTAIPAFLNAKCMFSNAINELAHIEALAAIAPC